MEGCLWRGVCRGVFVKGRKYVCKGGLFLGGDVHKCFFRVTIFVFWRKERFVHE